MSIHLLGSASGSYSCYLRTGIPENGGERIFVEIFRLIDNWVLGSDLAPSRNAELYASRQTIRYLVSTIIPTLHGLESRSSRLVGRFLAALDVFAAFYNHGVNRKLTSDLLGE